MSDPVALAGTIGTWAAVALAILALVGIIGPLLIWQASRDQRGILLSTLSLTAVVMSLKDNGRAEI
jgi:hypothetical protein